MLCPKAIKSKHVLRGKSIQLSNFPIKSLTVRAPGRLNSNTSIVVNVGKMCGKHHLKEEDLPATLLDILRTLQRFVFQVTYIRDPRGLTIDQRAR
jgi:hypothetical protein